MTVLTKNSGFLERLAENLILLVKRPPRMQVAALCHREVNGKKEVLLITSKTRKRWIIPKGWPMANRSARKTALMEAWEEAGIRGKVGKTPIGEYDSFKGLGNGFNVKTRVVVFPVEVTEEKKEFPEKDLRNRKWLSVEEAAERCNEAELSYILKNWAS